MAQTSRSNPAIGGAVPTLSNQIGDGSSVWVLGLADGIAQILKLHLKEREERAKEEIEESESKVAA